MLIEKFPLWDNVPGMCEEIPTITAFIPDRWKKSGAIVIFPDGGYSGRALHEGIGYAEFLAAQGYCSFVVDYRVAPHTFPLPLLDARRGVQFVRYYAEKYGIDAESARIAIVTNGFHVTRACMLASEQGYETVFGVGAPIPWWWLQVNYYLREAFALIKDMIF